MIELDNGLDNIEVEALAIDLEVTDEDYALTDADADLPEFLLKLKTGEWVFS